MHDRALRARDRLERPLDELRARLREDGDGRVVRDEVLLDQEPREVEVRLRRRREADLDLADAERDAGGRRTGACARASIGLTSAWLPSRRSVEHQIGARSRTRSGHVRSGRSTVAYGRYFQCGMGIGQRSFSDRVRRRTTGAGRLVYVDASLPLAGKDGEQEGQPAGRTSEAGPVMRARYPTRKRGPRMRIRAGRTRRHAAQRHVQVSAPCYTKFLGQVVRLTTRGARA